MVCGGPWWREVCGFFLSFWVCEFIEVFCGIHCCLKFVL